MPIIFVQLRYSGTLEWGYRAGSGIIGRSGVTGQLLSTYFFGVPVLIRMP